MRKKLLSLMEEKESNLVFSVDTTDPKKLLSLASDLGSKIALLKTHIDILDLSDYSDFITSLQKIAKREKFLLFEDRKFADIGSTAQKQFQGGPFQIAKWADLINAHALPGPGLIEALQKSARKETSLLLILEMSAKGSFAFQEYQNFTLELARTHSDFVLGFIAQKKSDPAFLHFTPGVSLDRKADSLGQQFRTPEEAILRDGCDLIIVGRSIYEANDPLLEAERYRKAAWEALADRHIALERPVPETIGNKQ